MSDSPVNLDAFLKFNMRVVLVGVVIFLVYMNLKNKHTGFVVVAGLIVLYLFTFITGRYYLREGFQNAQSKVENAKPLCSKEITQQDVVLDPETREFYDKPIDSVDDYEYSMVFENENDRELTKDLRSKLMSQYPMDWSTNPPSSSNFSKGLKEHFEDVSGATDISENPASFSYISGESMAPPDTEKIEEEERKILQTYKPKNTSDLKTYDVGDAYQLIKKIYDAKGEIPEVRHKKDTNVYEIVGVRRKDEKIVYEDEEGAYSPDRSAPSDVKVPPATVDVLTASDPFYDKQNRTRIDRNNYTTFTEGLERMFAPTYPVKAWW